MRHWQAVCCLLILGSTASAREVNVYLKDGQVVRGNLESIDRDAVRLDPEGPVQLRTFNAGVIDSVVSVDATVRVHYPMRETAVVPDFRIKKASHRHSSFSGKLFSIGGYVAYRFPKELAVIDPAMDVRIQVDGAVGGGIQASGLWPVRNSLFANEVWVEAGILGETISGVFPGGSLSLIGFRYMNLDVGYRLLVPLAGSGTRLYATPAVGIGGLITNLRQSSSPYTVSTTPDFDADLALMLGGGLELLSERKLRASVRFNMVYSGLFVDQYTTLDAGMFWTPEVRVALELLHYD